MLPSAKPGKDNRGRKSPRSPEVQNDLDLAARLGKGDKDALRELLDRNLSSVYGYISRRLGPGHDDLAARFTEETFRFALAHLRPYLRGSAKVPMRLWLLGLAGRQIAHGRVKPPGRELMQARETPRLAWLRHRVYRLSQRKQAALALALFEDLSAGEVAGALGTSLPRAMGLVRSALKAAGEVAPPPVESSGG